MASVIPEHEPANEPARKTIHEIKSGETIDRFHVGERVHEGGMSCLYRVTHPQHRLPMIMKVPKLGAGAPLAAFSAFENEVRIMQRLKGRHVPRLFGVGELMRAPYLVMEYIEGDELAQAVERAPLGVPELAERGRRLCGAIHDLHRQNVIHLDLNPRNVRNRRNGDILLVDFGLAHHAQLPDMIDAAFGEEEGTTAFISPEQVRHIRNEPRSDVFAIGAVLYLLATGEYPFGRPNLISLKKRLFQAPAAPRAHNPDLPEWMQEIILRCLETHPENRYRSAKQVAHFLSHPDAVKVGRRGRHRRRRRWLARAGLWFKSFYTAFDDLPGSRPAEHLTTTPHVLVALDLNHASDALKEALRRSVRKFAHSEPHSYFTFMNVMPTSEAYAEGGTETRTAPMMSRLAELNNWAQPLRLMAERQYFQVIPAGDAASAIVDYARHHMIDYIIVGARASSALRRYLGSVSAKVVAESPCTVTVVRSRRDTEAGF